MRWVKAFAPVASLALLVSLGIAQSRGDDATTPAGKATVTVTVVDAAGKAVPGAAVMISVAPPKGGKKHAATTQPDGAGAAKPAKPVAIETGVTGTDGTYALTKLADGDFVVSARVKGSGAGKSTVTIADGKDQAVSITLKAGKKRAGGA